MAATYRVKASNVVFGSGKSLLALWNGAGSANVLKVNRIWLLNNQVGTAAGTGVIIELQIVLITAHTASNKILPVKMVQTSAALDVNVACSSGATVTESSIFRRVSWSGDEPAQSELTTDTLQLIPSLNLVWDAGYVGSGLEPLTLNASQGVHVKCVTATTATYMGDIIIEFTT